MDENTAEIRPEEKTELGPKWPAAKLILGIISMVLFVLVFFQSCAVGIGDSILDSGEAGGSFGVLIALNLLISGIIAVVVRNSVKKTGILIAVALLWLNYFFAKLFAGTFSDLVIWGFICFAFGVVYLLSAVRTKKGIIIACVVSAVYLAIALI